MKNNFIRYIYYTELLYTPIPWDYETARFSAWFVSIWAATFYVVS